MVSRTPTPITPDTRTLPTPRFEALAEARWSLAYDPHYDVMKIIIGEPRPAISVDLAGEMWLRMDPQTGEILGFEIEDFEKVFVRNHRELGVQRSRLTQVFGRPRSEPVSWVRALFEFVKKLCADNGGGGSGHFAPA